MLAVFSPCRKYRYRLDREINQNGVGTYLFIGINPSDADESKDDPTVTRMISHARNNNAKNLIVSNVFSWVDKDVNALAELEDPFGPERELYLSKIINDADVIVVCWGNKSKVPKQLHGHFNDLLDKLSASGKPVMCIAKNKSGDPGHPLFLPTTKQLMPYFD